MGKFPSIVSRNLFFLVYFALADAPTTHIHARINANGYLLYRVELQSRLVFVLCVGHGMRCALVNIWLL